MGKQAPAGGDYTGAAQKQAQSSATNTAQQTAANRPDQSTNFGSSQWKQNPDGSWSQSSSLNGGLGTAAGNLMNQAGADLSTPMDWSQFGTMQDGSEARDQAIKASYDQSTSRLNPQWAGREQTMQSGLANQGLDPNSQAYRNASRQFGQDRNDAYGSAMNSAIMQGQAAGDSVFRNNMMSRQQAIAEALKRRGMSVSDLQGLQGFLQQSGFMGAQSSDPTQYLNAAMGQDNYGLNAWDATNRANADVWKGGTEAVKGAASFLPLFAL